MKDGIATEKKNLAVPENIKHEILPYDLAILL